MIRVVQGLFASRGVELPRLSARSLAGCAGQSVGGMPSRQRRLLRIRRGFPTLFPVCLLKSRGLVIADEQRAKHYLRFVGYYRLAGYALPFQVNYNADGSHRFLDGVSFEDILDLYVFDRKLRLAVMDAVERIEVAFRAQFSQTISELHGPHWFMDAAHFVPS